MAGLPGGIGQFAQRHVAQVTKFNQEHAPTLLLSTAGGLARDRCSKVDPVRKQSIVPFMAAGENGASGQHVA